MSVKEVFKYKKEVTKEKINKLISSKKGKVTVVVGVVAVLCIGIFVSKRFGNIDETTTMEGIVETYSIPENEKIFMNGSIKPKESKSINVDLGYEITKVNVSNGQYVTKGEPLFLAKNQEVLNQISDLESELKLSEDPDSIKSEINKLKNKSYKTTYAPISGTVYLEEESADSEISSAYMTIESTDYYMKGKISEQDLPKIRKNMAVDIYIFATEEDIKGKISSISFRPSTSQENQDTQENSSMSYYDVTVEFDSQEGLVNGYHIQASVEIENENAKIPVTSVLRDEEGKKDYVYKVIDNKLVKQVINITSKNEDFVVLESGLVQNDMIVRFPSEDMKEGDNINLDSTYTNDSYPQEYEEGRFEISNRKVVM